MPPDYIQGKLKPIKPIKSANDNYLIYKSQAGSLIVPKQENSTYKSLEGRIFSKGQTTMLRSRLKIFKEKLYPKCINKTLEKRHQERKLSDEIKETEYFMKFKSLSPAQNLLLKKFNFMSKF